MASQLSLTNCPECSKAESGDIFEKDVDVRGTWSRMTAAATNAVAAVCTAATSVKAKLHDGDRPCRCSFTTTCPPTYLCFVLLFLDFTSFLHSILVIFNCFLSAMATFSYAGPLRLSILIFYPAGLL